MTFPNQGPIKGCYPSSDWYAAFKNNPYEFDMGYSHMVNEQIGYFTVNGKWR